LEKTYRPISDAVNECFRFQISRFVSKPGASKPTVVENRDQISDFVTPSVKSGKGWRNIWAKWTN